MQSALDRVIRTLVVAIGIGSILFSLLGLPSIIEQHAFLNQFFSLTMIIVFCGLPPIMALVAFRAPVPLLRTLALVLAIASLAFLVAWVPAMTDPAALVGGGLPWIINTIAVATSAAAIALPFIPAWIYMLLVTITSGVVRYISYGSADPSQAIQDSIMLLLLSGFMMALIQLTLLAGREQDAAAAAAQETATTNAARASAGRQRTRYHALTRDEVVATLYTASHNTPDSREVARQSAMLTLLKLNQPATLAPLVVTVPFSELDVQLRTAAVAHGISYASSATADDGPLDVPTEVGDALLEAMTEAMRNSNRHADGRDGSAAHRTVRTTRLPHGLEIVIKDNGRGFNPRRVGVDRLGVRLHILERVNSQPGASADVLSVRGRGTTVTLDWNEGRNAE